MDSEKPPLAQSIRRLGERARRDSGQHPAVEQLVAYRAGTLPSDQEERLRDHLVLCRECAGMLLDLASFPDLEPPAGVPALSDEEVAAALLRIQPRLERAAHQPALAQVVPLRREPTPRPSRFVYVLAAALAFMTVGLIWRVISLNGTVRNLSAPRFDVALVDLVPSTEVSRAGGAEESTVPRGGDRFVLLLNLREEPSQSSFEADLLDSKGTLLWRGRAAGGSKTSFTLDMPRRLTPPGRYRIDLYGIDGSRRTKLADYPFVVDAD